jgi:hypothetical protein
MTHKLLAFLLTIFSLTANAKLMFEGYLRIENHGKHIGYVIQKDEVDDKTKVRTVTYLVWKNINGAVSQDALQVVAKPAPPPALYSGIKYTNWMWTGDEGSIATGEFGAKELTVVRKVLGSGEVIEKGKMPIPPDSIFSSMVTTTLAESDPAKYTTGRKASYVALSEEDAKFDTLDIQVEETKTIGDQKIAHVLSEMLNDKLESFTFMDGQVLGTRDDYNDQIVFLVNRREDAFGDFGPAETIKRIFGDVPRGLRNPVSESQGKLDAKEVIHSFQSPRAKKNQPPKKH